MAPPARIEHELMSSGVKLTWGPIILLVARSADVISAISTLYHSFTLKMASNCVLLGAPFCCKCDTRRLMAATAHARGWPVSPCLMDYPLMPFFCVVKRRLKKFTEAHVAGKAMLDELGWVPTKSWIYHRLRRVEKVSVSPAQYLPGWSRKNNAIQSRL